MKQPRVLNVLQTCAFALALGVGAPKAVAQDAAAPGAGKAGGEPAPSQAAPAAPPATSPAAPPAAEPSATEPGPAPAAPAPEPSAAPSAPSPQQTAATADTSAAQSVQLSSAVGSEAIVHGDTLSPKPAPAEDQSPVVTGSHIGRPRLMPDGVLVIDSPLTTELQGRDYLQTRRQLGGVAMPDTTAALAHSKGGGPGTDSYELRLQPTLILLNGRRLVSAPYSRTGGADYVDINQIPLQLLDHIETTRGMTGGLYGDGAIGGTVNFVTRHDYKGAEVEVGGQTTDRFDQSDKDVSLTFGVGSKETGMNAMVSYFNRQPLAASDRNWISDRKDRVLSLLGSPASFQQLTNFNYPFPDPFCGQATKAGHAAGLQVRLPGYYGPPKIIGLLPDEAQRQLLMNQDVARGNGNGKIEALETATYCATDFTPTQDLVIKDERIQTYSTFWHKFSNHAEGYGELGYYRSDNQNRTAPSFPIIRLAADTTNASRLYPVWVPTDHADQPVQEKGFSAVDVTSGRIPNAQFIVGRVDGLYAGSNLNKRREDVFRGVLGVKGDLKGLAKDSVLDSWNWDLAGVYSRTEAYATVPDVLMDRLADALRACSATKPDPAGGAPVPTTIKQRQEAGCYNPFYSSVLNNAALDPLGVYKGKKPSSQNGFVTTDTDKNGVQDGGYICDPNDPNSPACPAAFDRYHDGSFALAGTPNTKQVMDRLMGQQTTQTHRALGTVDGSLQGDLTKFDRGGLAFGLGAQYRRESLGIDYDQAYNQRQYAFLYGAPDVPNVSRSIGAGYAELRLRLFDGLIELQPAVRVEHYQTVGTAASPLAGLAIRPLAADPSPPKALEWLLLRGHVGRGYRAPSLMQMYGSQTDLESVNFFGNITFVPHQVMGNPHLDFERYTTVSGGLQWDFVGIHVGADFWTSKIDNVIAGDNSKTLIHDCQAQYNAGHGDCGEQALLAGSRILDHIQSTFDNLASVSTNGADGGASYTLDTKKRGIGEYGTFALGVQGTFINSYLIDSARALREYYRLGQDTPDFNKGKRDYSTVHAEYQAAGFRNADNFAPPMPRLRFSVPLRWLYEGHVVGFTMRYIGGYHDDSEYTIERYGLAKISDLATAQGEAIPSWVVFDANYGYTFNADGTKVRLSVGVINLFDRAPPAVESPLGYEVGVHDPRGRLLYARVTGSF
jgi:outer membrane receptor protein involved in Fe transport